MSLWDPNIIPTELDADGTNPRVGRDKSDPIPVDPTIGVLAHEWNVVKTAIPWLHTKIGTEDAPDYRSLRGILGGDAYYRYDAFDAEAAGLSHVYQSIIAPPALLTVARAGLRFTLDAAKDIATRGYYFERAQRPYVRCRITLDGNPDTFIMYFTTAAGTEGWGVAIETAGTKIRGYHRDAGVNTYTDVGVWVVSTEFVLEFWISANTLYVSKDGATAVNCGAVAAGDVMFAALSTVAGAAGKFLDIRGLLRLADWS